MEYGIGDVHGCFDKFKYLLEKEIKLTRAHQIYCVGDIITKGSQNLALLEYFMWLRKNDYQVTSVMGNHEYRILTLFYTDFDLLEKYLAHYNCLDILAGEVDQIMDLLGSFPFFVELKDWIIAHSFLGINLSAQSDVRNMLGGKNFSTLSASSINNKRQLFGHRAISLDELERSIRDEARLINVDTGCVYHEYGHLSALNLATLELISV